MNKKLPIFLSFLGGGTTTRGCRRNSTCLCENTCDSLADKPDSCLSFYCIDDCSCPIGFTYSNTTKRCERDLDCPCVKNGTIFKVCYANALTGLKMFLLKLILGS